MNNITTFLLTFIKMLNTKEPTFIYEFAEQNEFSLKDIFEIIIAIKDSYFCEAGDIQELFNFTYSYNGKDYMEAVLVEESDMAEKVKEKGTYNSIAEKINKYKNNKQIFNIFLKVKLSNSEHFKEEKKYNCDEALTYIKKLNTEFPDHEIEIITEYYCKKDENKVEFTYNELAQDLERFGNFKMSVKEDINHDISQELMNCFLNFTINEKVELYNMVCGEVSEKIESASEIKEMLKGDCEEKQKVLKGREVVKIPKVNIIENMNKLLALYDYITDTKIVAVNITNKVTKAVIKSVKLTRVFYDMDAYTWKLEYLQKGNKQSIRLDYLEDDIDDSIEISSTLNIASEKKKYNKKEIKFRVYNEMNAKEKAVRYAVKYEMQIININDEFSDILIKIHDSEKFLRWARTMTPSVIILEPVDLRNKMINEINEWKKIYEK